MRFSLALTTVVGALGMVEAIPNAEAAPKNPKYVESKKLQSEVNKKGLMGNLGELDKIAKANNGNRAFGYSGYDASVDYVLSKLKKSKTFKSWTQDFPGWWTQTQSIDFTVSNTTYYIFGLTYTPSTTAEGLNLPLVLGPDGDAGCSAEGYSGFDVTGKIVLIPRGTCPTGGTLAGRVLAAKGAGAAAAVLYNSVETKPTGGTLSDPVPEKFIPSGLIYQKDGLDLKARLQGGEELTAHFQVTQAVEEKITRNVFAESKGGDPNNVIMLGAHLDSVVAGAGINDDGSGTSLILELFDAIQKYNVRNKVRFAWWGAEENGLVGSRYYTRNLPAQDVDNLLAYLNFDMVSRGYFGVFDGDGSTHGLAGAAGSEVIEKLFVDHLTSKGVTVTPAIFTGGSDYASFMTELKKPVGGLHTGTGVEQDACYHQACDTYDNANSTVITTNAKAAAHVLATLAVKGHELIPKAPSNSTLEARADSFGLLADIDSFPWTQGEGERHLSTCGHEI